MPIPSTIPVPSPSEIKALLFPNGKMNPPALPNIWQAKALLTPPGSTTVGGTPRDELIAAIFTYDCTTTVPLLRAQLYALESLKYFDLLFASDSGSNLWWSLQSDPSMPDDPPTKISSAFTSSIVVPAPSLFASEFTHVGSWKTVGRQSHAFSGRRTANPSTWIWLDAQRNRYRRMMNVDSSNDFGLPILGSFYFVDFTTFDPLVRSDLPTLFAEASKDTPGVLAIRTYRDLASAMVSPELGGGIACKFTDIQSILPGLEAVNPGAVPPKWTDSVHSQCFMMGQDSYPYYCQLWYDWNRGCQVTVFVQKTGGDEYEGRFDEFLPKGRVGPAVIYRWSGTQWEAVCSQANGGFVPMPVPDFVTAGRATCRASFRGSDYFGDLTIWSVALGDQNSGWSDFWYWFDHAGRGVIFSLAPARSLTLIDYQTFDQNPAIPADVFKDPTPSIPACADNNLMALSARPRFRPIHH